MYHLIILTGKLLKITSPCGDSGVSMGSAVETPPTACRVLTFDSQTEQSSVSPPAAKCTPVSRSTELIINSYFMPSPRV